MEFDLCDLGAVDVLHGEGVAEDEGDALVFAEVGEPVPREHALAADDQILAEGLDGVEEGIGFGGGDANVEFMPLNTEPAVLRELVSPK